LFERFHQAAASARSAYNLSIKFLDSTHRVYSTIALLGIKVFRVVFGFLREFFVFGHPVGFEGFLSTRSLHSKSLVSVPNQI
jgi:hypothetical protein